MLLKSYRMINKDNRLNLCNSLAVKIARLFCAKKLIKNKKILFILIAY